MDIYAYANIENLESIAKQNGIDCPRLRGYRLMAFEEPVNYKEMDSYIHADFYSAAELCKSIPFWSINPSCWELSSKTDNKLKKYIIGDEYDSTKPRRVKWENIHGWKRRVLKLAIHNERKRIREQMEMFNKYCGRKDILYIHARIGGGNWPYYYEEVIHQPWFIEKVDDSFDNTYCDIYAKLTDLSGISSEE